MSTMKEFCWSEPKGWEPLLLEVMPPEQRSRLMALLPTNLDTQYLDDIEAFWDVYAHVGDREELAEWIPAHLRSVFGRIWMFHCCRPVDVGSYYQRGIQVLDVEIANRQFRDIFLGNPRWSWVTERDLDAAIETMTGTYRRDGHVYFGLDDRYLVEYCGHYLIYGSEYLQALAARISSGDDFSGKAELTRFGTPTVFAVSLPISHLSDRELFELGEAALHLWAYRRLHPRKAKRRLIDFGIGIAKALPPDCLVSHHHPESVPDPTRRRLLYQYKEGRWMPNPDISA